jgi:Cu/Ag efflux protein CusF
MKKLLPLALVLVFAIVFADRGIAQQSVEDKGQAAKTKQPATSEVKSLDKASPKLVMTGKVTQVDPATKTFTVMAKGKPVTFHGGNLKSLPKVGDVVDITYTENPSGPAESINLNSSRSNIY